MSKPTHIAHVITKQSHVGREDIWRPVGAVFQHTKGKGFDLVIHDQISVSGRIVCIERKDKPAAEAPAAEATAEAQEAH